MNSGKKVMRILSVVLALIMVIGMMPVSALAATDNTLAASMAEAQSYIDGMTVNNSSNDPSTVVSTFKTHFTWDNEKRENSKSYLFDWSYYNGVVFEGIEYLYEVTGDEKYADYVIEYMSSLIAEDGTWAYCSNNSSKQCAGYNSTHGADCYKTASLLLDAYEMTGDTRYLTMAATLYADLDTAAANSTYNLKNAGNNFRHTWASDPSPDLWLDGLYMILPFRAEYAKYIGDTEELDLIVSRMQWVSDNMYNEGTGLFYHAADSATSNSGTYWLRSIGWYAAAIVDIMDSMDGENLEAMQAQLIKLVDGMIACQNTTNGMWLNNMAASESSTNPYETSGTALVCYAIMKAVNNGWLDESYAQYAILAFNGICEEKLDGDTLTDICFKGAPGSSNSTFYDNEGKGVGPFIMFYAEVLEFANNDSCDHTYETVTVNATCTADGSITTTCTLCGEETVEVVDATGHNYTAVVTKPTCTEGGVTTYTCANCGDIYTADNTTATGHDYKTVTVEATCIEDGSVTTTCSTCGETDIEVIPATGHSYSTVTVEPTCTEDGYTSCACERCGDGYVYDETVATGHDYKTVVVAATCENDGYSIHTCENCGDSYTDTVIAAQGHNNTSVVTEATCETDGYTTHTCTACGEVTVDSYVEAAGHAYETVTVAATCTEDGSAAKTCANCGDSTIEVIPATGHNYAVNVTEATCTETGFTTYTCENCNDSYTEETAALGHNYTAAVTAATCTEAGFTTYSCENCGDTYTADETEALGHSYVDITRKATCTEGGFTIHSCENCSNSYTDSYTDALGHDVVSVVTEATCETDGYTMHICENCGETTVDTYVDAFGHDYAVVVTAATCTEDGFTTYTCKNCGNSYTADTTAATGHSYVCSEEEDCLVYICENCGDTYTEEIANKTYTKVTSLSSDNEYVITFYSGRKYYALAHENNKISAIQVTVSNGVITSEITDDMVWSYNNSKLSYDDNGTTYYLYGTKSNSGWGGWWGNSSYTLSISTSNSSTVTFSNSRLKVGSYYLRYSGGSVTLSSSSTTTYLFIEE